MSSTPCILFRNTSLSEQHHRTWPGGSWGRSSTRRLRGTCKYVCARMFLGVSVRLYLGGGGFVLFMEAFWAELTPQAMTRPVTC